MLETRRAGMTVGLFVLAWILIFFNWNITVGTAVVGLLPDCIGYLLLWFLLRDMGKKERSFRWAGVLCLVMTGVSAALYAVDLLGCIGEVETMVASGLGLLMAAPAVVLAWLLIQGWIRVTATVDAPSLKLLFWLLAATEAGTYVFLFFPILAYVALFGAFAVKIFLPVLLKRTGGAIFPPRVKGKSTRRNKA